MTLTYSDALLRLRNHADLVGSGPQVPADQSLLHALYLADRGEVPPEFDTLAQDVVSCLGVVNTHLNGATPSESPVHRMRDLPAIAEVSCAASGIVAGCLQEIVRWRQLGRFEPPVLDRLECHAYLIAYALAQVLAGDIDDLLEGADAAIS